MPTICCGYCGGKQISSSFSSSLPSRAEGPNPGCSLESPEEFYNW